MLSLLVVIIIVASVSSKKKRDNRKSDFFRFAVIGGILLATAAALIPPLGALAVIFLIWLFISKYNEYRRNAHMSQDEWSDKAKEAGFDKENLSALDKFMYGIFEAFDSSSARRGKYSTNNNSYTYADETSDVDRLQKEVEILSRQRRTSTYAGNAMGNAGRNTAQSNVYANYNRSNAQAAKNAGYQTNAGGYNSTSRNGDAAFNKGDMHLPSSPKRRRKIVVTFNEKYNLDLTDDQIDNIVNASYFSAAWHKEIVDMNKKYVTVHQWINGPLAWLRTYIYVFHIQDITSDLYQQERIVVYAFDQVFAYLDSLGPMTMANRIRIANQKFLTDFDDITFMNAYNFLRSKGINYEMKMDDVSQSYDPIDDLMEKYAAEPQTQTQGQ